MTYFVIGSLFFELLFPIKGVFVGGFLFRIEYLRIEDGIRWTDCKVF